MKYYVILYEIFPKRDHPTQTYIILYATRISFKNIYLFAGYLHEKDIIYIIPTYFQVYNSKEDI